MSAIIIMSAWKIRRAIAQSVVSWGTAVTKVADLNLLTYVVKLQAHKALHVLHVDTTYYLAIEKEHDNDILKVPGHAICYTRDIAQAKIFETGLEAQRVGKTLEGCQTIRTTVHPVSRKIFFEASLKGLR